MENLVVWFDIPVQKIDRACEFYADVMGVEMQPMDNGPVKMAFFPFQPGTASGALVESEARPNADGTVVYLNGGDDLADKLARVEAAGGKIISGKTSIGEHGHVAYFMDTEGNRVALHSMH